ncbi:hypothetical protein [Conexibacter woesei]|uniref:hypothetical protein n=1 Tax=Conexibacter woesei TaxID=191495 RepID=UPI0012DFE64B|nr:hypothetical protein [Conexibacter woesei]
MTAEIVRVQVSLAVIGRRLQATPAFEIREPDGQHRVWRGGTHDDVACLDIAGRWDLRWMLDASTIDAVKDLKEHGVDAEVPLAGTPVEFLPTDAEASRVIDRVEKCRIGRAGAERLG